MDGDTDVTFRPDGAVEVTEYGYGVQDYKGRYRLDGDGVLWLQLEGYKAKWPTMVLERDAKSLLLRRKDAKKGFEMGSRGAATISGGDGSYWPFRVVERKPFEKPASQPSR